MFVHVYIFMLIARHGFCMISAYSKRETRGWKMSSFPQLSLLCTYFYAMIYVRTHARYACGYSSAWFATCQRERSYKTDVTKSFTTAPVIQPDLTRTMPHPSVRFGSGDEVFVLRRAPLVNASNVRGLIYSTMN